MLTAMLVMRCGLQPNPQQAATDPSTSPGADPLPFWNEGAAKQAIIGFADRVTTEGGPDFVAVNERIAVFDNDGTLWAEQPVYFQLIFVFDRIKAMAPQHLEWLEGDLPVSKVEN